MLLKLIIDDAIPFNSGQCCSSHIPQWPYPLIWTFVELLVLVEHISLPSGFSGYTSVQLLKNLLCPFASCLTIANGKIHGFHSPDFISLTWQPMGQLDPQSPQFPFTWVPFSSVFVEHQGVLISFSHVQVWNMDPWIKMKIMKWKISGQF